MNERKTFTDLGVEEALAAALADQDIHHPFPIQELTLPLALKGADLIGQARTGTGKTLAFGLPLLQRIDEAKQATQALVVVPTRELCLQVAEDLEVGKQRGITVMPIYGGVGYEPQIDALRGGVHVVVGTPGRTLDHLERGNLQLDDVHVVVLDEADEMLDMGFLPDVERLLSACPDDRQTMLFSATMPTAIVKLARRFMDHPTFMRAEMEERNTAPTVDQQFFVVHRMDKPRVLARILQTPDRGGAFVFTRTKNMADRLVRELEDLGVGAIAVHGDLRQSTREKNLDRFRDGKADVLVATEVAARGLDVDNVTHVINYDCPDDEKMYLHRIGRTARAGAAGQAVTFAEFNEVDRLNVIRKAVSADTEIAEVFSTSELLTERFALPAETPWEHLAKSAKSTGQAAAKSRRTSKSDGRPKSSRTSEGPSSRRRKRADDHTPREAPARRAAGERKAEEPTAEKPEKSETGHGTDRDNGRTRTRTRTRTRESSSTTSASTGRTRARDGASDTSTRDRTSGDTPQRDRKKSRGDQDNGSGTSRSKSSRGGDKSKGRSGGKARANDRTSSPTPKTAVAATRRGADARGDGTPRPRRRVQVEHLP